MYEERLKAKFNSNEKISQTNKKHVKDFFNSGYNCTKTTEGKFYSWLPYILTKTTDIKKTMEDEKELVKVFNQIHKDLSPSGYTTVFWVTKTLCKFLKNGNNKKKSQYPEAFESVKELSKIEKKQLKRVNQEGYKTLSWEDGLKICKQTNSVQLKAMILCQLDGGLRPSELEALNYEDTKKEGKFITLHIKAGKTAEPRDVVLFRSAPSVSRWLELHPKKEGALWLMEDKTRSSSYREGNKDLRYRYAAIKQTFRRLAKKAGFKKGVSLYMFRHSAISLAKQERMSAEIGAERFGHNITYYVDTYGKLTQEQKINRQKQAQSGEEAKKEKKEPEPILCSICDTINEPRKDFCEKCNSPLTLTKALEIKNKHKEELEQMKNDLKEYFKEQFKKEIKAEVVG